MPPPYYKSWQLLYAALESGPNFPTSLRIHVPDTIFFNDHKFPHAWYSSYNYRLKKKYDDHLNIPRVCEDLLKKSTLSSTFAFHFETYSEFLTKREFILRAKGWMHAETRHPTEIPWVLQMYNVPTMDKTTYLTSYLQPGQHPFSLVTNITALPFVERQKKQTEPLQFNKMNELQIHTYQAEIGGAKLSLRDPLFLRMKRLKLHLVRQVEKCKNMAILSTDNPTLRCLICEFLNGPESGEVQLINVLGYHLKGREPSWMIDISGSVYDKRIESFMAKKLNFELYTEARTPRKSPYTRGAKGGLNRGGRRRNMAERRLNNELDTPEEDEAANNANKKSVLDDPEQLRRENAINEVFYKLYKDMKKKLQRPIDVFKRIDTDENGTISPKELRVGLLKDLGFVFTDEEFKTVIEIIDADGSGEIEYGELTQRIKNSDPERRERLKKQALRREKLDNQRLKIKAANQKNRSKGRKTIKFSKMVNEQNKTQTMSEIRAQRAAAAAGNANGASSSNNSNNNNNNDLPTSFVPPIAANEEKGKREINNSNKSNDIKRELNEKTALLQAAQKLVKDLQDALGQSLKHVPKPPKYQQQSNNSDSTPLSSRVVSDTNTNNRENTKLIAEISKLKFEIKSLSSKLSDEREANLISMRRHEQDKIDNVQKMKTLEDELEAEKQKRRKLENMQEKMKSRMEENNKRMAKLNDIMQGRTNNALKKPVANAMQDPEEEEDEEDRFDRHVLQYVASQNEPMFRWVFLTYAEKDEGGMDHVIQLEDVKRFVFDAQILKLDANKLASLYLRSNGNVEYNMDFSHFVELMVRMADDLYHRKEKVFSDRFTKFIAEHIVPLANMIIGDAADDV